MYLEKLRKSCQSRSVIFVMMGTFLLSLTWYNIKDADWPHLNILTCKEKNDSSLARLDLLKEVKIDSDSSLPRLDLLKEVKIDRILYAKPEALKPTRTDVLMVTPWLAPIVWNGIYNTDILNAQFHQRGVRIGLTVFAIKKYVQFMEAFLETAEKFFMVGHQVNYYVLTDQPNKVPNITLGERRQLVILEVPAYKRWQDITMRRMQIIRDYAHERFIKEVDYIVCLDVDMKFTDDVGVEILSDVFGAIHPGFFTASRKDFTNERRPESAGYVAYDEGDFYYTGCYFGGTIEEIYKLTNYCHHAMLADKEKNMEALWHDESYLNRYFLYHKPTKVLSPEYVWNYYYGNPAVVQKKRFIVVPKDYAKVRDKRSVLNN